MKFFKLLPLEDGDMIKRDIKSWDKGYLKYNKFEGLLKCYDFESVKDGDPYIAFDELWRNEDWIKIEGPKKATAYFDFTMTTECPHCKEEINLDNLDHESDNENNLYAFKHWINNEQHEDYTEECPHCEKEFVINKIVR